VHVAPTPFGADGLFGGGERYPLELARALAQSVECELITFGRRPGVARQADGLTVRVLAVRRHLRGHPAHPLAPALPAVIRSADIVHTHHLRSAPGQIAAISGRALGRRVVTTDHGLAGGDLGGLLPRLVHRFLTVSRYSAQTLGAPPERTTVIYGGADPERFRPDPSERREGILFVGRFTPHKGVDRLLRALPEGAKLTCVGSAGHDPRPPESAYPALLRRLAAGRDVTFAEGIGDDDLAGLYRRARVVVLPSVHDTCYGRRVAVSELLGLSVLEAMASGTPVICSRLGGLPEVVDDGVTGFLVEPGDVDALHQRLDALVRDAPGAERMGRAGREVALERFTWGACARRCLDAYEALMSGDAPAPPGGRG
jgi:glycosyltransferase involved in cell wall biosynthesis